MLWITIEGPLNAVACSRDRRNKVRILGTVGDAGFSSVAHADKVASASSGAWIRIDAILQTTALLV